MFELVVDEPVRGRRPPPWYWSMPGPDRYRAYRRGLLPAVPASRLLGVQLLHSAPGEALTAMPASVNFSGINGEIQLLPVTWAAANCAASTLLSPGQALVTTAQSFHYFHRVRPGPGSVRARARVVGSSPQFVATVVEVEDALGRHSAGSFVQSAVVEVDPPPPPAPDPLPAVVEEEYATPDPPLRPLLGGFPSEAALGACSGLEAIEAWRTGAFPAPPTAVLAGTRFSQAAEGTVTMTMPTSEWFAYDGDDVQPGMIAQLAVNTAWAAAITTQTRFTALAAPQLALGFPSVVPVGDGLLTAVGRVRTEGPGFYGVEVVVNDSAGRTVCDGTATLIPAPSTATNPAPPARILTTILMTDIVGSTDHAERLGDGPWRALLDQHHALVRGELAHHQGREVKTTGDGFLARFESPGAAVRCARAVRDGVRRFGIEVRTGVHTGECEVQGNDLAGIAVHVAARVMSEAQPGDVVVSTITRDLSAGTGLHFTSCGPRDLKGVAEAMELHALVDA